MYAVRDDMGCRAKVIYKAKKQQEQEVMLARGNRSARDKNMAKCSVNGD